MKTMNQLIDDYLADLKSGRIRPATRYKYSNCVKKYIAPVIGPLPIAAVDSKVIVLLIRKVAEDGEYASARCCATVLSRIFKMAIQNRNITVNPMDGISTALCQPTGPQVLDAGRYVDLRKGIIAWEKTHDLVISRSQDLHEITDLLFYTGVRPNELFALRWNDVDLVADPPTAFINAAISRTGNGSAVIQEHPKTRTAIRHLTIPASIAAQLQARRARQTTAATPNPLNLVFPSPTGTVCDSTRASTTLHSVARALGFGEVGLAAFRQAGAGRLQ